MSGMRLCHENHNQVAFEDHLACPVCDLMKYHQAIHDELVERIAGLVADRNEKVQIIELLERRIDRIIAMQGIPTPNR